MQHHFVQIDGLRIHYAEAGAGEPLILLHGWPQHWWEWRHVIGPLSRRYRVICPDLRGLGWSEGRADGFTFQRMAQDVIDLMDHLQLPRTRIVGRDWGLVTGYRACLDHPERFEQFVALAGVHPWTGDDVRPAAIISPWHVYLLALQGDSRILQDWISKRSLHAWRHRGQFTPDEIAVYQKRMHTPAAYAATVAFNRNVVLREVPYFLRNYRSLRPRVPTLHLNGARDPLCRGIPHSYHAFADAMRLESLPDCGHFVPEEQPEQLTARMLGFFG